MLLITILLVGGVLFAAGGKEVTMGDSSKKVTLTYWDYSSNTDLNNNPTLRKALELFKEKYPNVEVVVSGKGRPEQLYDALAIAFSADNGPDLFWANVGAVVSPYVDNGKVLDMTSLAEQENWSDIFYSSSIDTQKTLFDGIYALPKAQKVMGIFYNKHLFDRFGFSEPKSIDEFLAQCEILQSAGIIPIGNAGKWAACTNRWFDGFLEINCGPEMHDRMLVGEASLNSPEVIKSFEDLESLSRYFQEGHLSSEETEVNMLMFQNKLCFTYDGTWEVDSIKSAGLDPNDFGFFLFPGTDPARANSYGDGIFVNAKSKNEDMALEFIKCYSQAECYQEAFESSQAITVARPDVIDISKLDGLNQQLVAAMNSSVGSYLPSNEMSWPAKLTDILLESIDQVILGTLTPTAAAANLDATAKTIGFYK